MMSKKSLCEMQANIDNKALHDIPVFSDTDMIPSERRFISGLVRSYRPKNILEVGVAAGGGTVNLLKSIEDMDAKLTSVDNCEIFRHPILGSLEVGYLVRDTYKGTLDNFRLYKGEDPAIVMPKLNEKFDFLVLDTGHAHPCESFNFLCILPYLTDDAICVLHDISLYADVNINRGVLRCFATRVLFSCVCAEKIVDLNDPRDEFCNIGAFQISDVLKKHLRNVFDGLMLPWEYWPDNLNIVKDFINSHYNNQLVKMFNYSVNFNKKLRRVRDQYEKDKRNFNDFFDRLDNKSLVFYGAGHNMRKILDKFNMYNRQFNYRIWDRNALEIGAINGHRVYIPDYESASRDTIIITIADENVYLSIRDIFEKLGYSVIHATKGNFMQY